MPCCIDHSCAVIYGFRKLYQIAHHDQPSGFAVNASVASGQGQKAAACWHGLPCLDHGAVLESLGIFGLKGVGTKILAVKRLGCIGIAHIKLTHGKDPINQCPIIGSEQFYFRVLLLEGKVCVTRQGREHLCTAIKEIVAVNDAVAIAEVR